MFARLPVLCLMIAWLILVCPVAADDQAEIKALIPAATEINKDDLKKVANSAVQPQAKDFADQPLTLLLLIRGPRTEITEAQKTEFETLGERGHIPAELAEAIAGGRFTADLGGTRFAIGPFGPATLIRSNRITAFTCDVKDNRATGTVSFKVPDAYQGKLHYVADKKDGSWRISELSMPANRIHVIRGESGGWQEKK